ncbi:MAG: hypothetical protein JOY80_12955 [Candidatus Dormibacteraeota bacterium]|nr:hypothetical protein [Candidatus Dormibacteraeota bacterium]
MREFLSDTDADPGQTGMTTDDDPHPLAQRRCRAGHEESVRRVILIGTVVAGALRQVEA